MSVPSFFDCVRACPGIVLYAWLDCLPWHACLAESACVSAARLRRFRNARGEGGGEGGEDPPAMINTLLKIGMRRVYSMPVCAIAEQRNKYMEVHIDLKQTSHDRKYEKKFIHVSGRVRTGDLARVRRT